MNRVMPRTQTLPAHANIIEYKESFLQVPAAAILRHYWLNFACAPTRRATTFT
jgi:hypothetical protein